MSEQWIAWRERTVHIPPFDHCMKCAQPIVEHKDAIALKDALTLPRIFDNSGCAM